MSTVEEQAQPAEPPWGELLEWPIIDIRIGTDPTGRQVLTVQGEHVELADAATDVYQAGIAAAATKAAALHRPVRALATNGQREWPLIIYPDGVAVPDEREPPQPRPRRHDRRLPLGIALGAGGLVLLLGIGAGMLVTRTSDDRALPPAAAPLTPSPEPHDPHSSAPARPSPRPAATPLVSSPPAASSTPSSGPSHAPSRGQAQPTISFPGSHTPRPTSAVRSPAVRAAPRPTSRPTTLRRSPLTPTVTVTATPSSTPAPRADSDSDPTSGPTVVTAPTARALTGQVRVTPEYCLQVESGQLVVKNCDSASNQWSFAEGQLLYAGRCLSQDDRVIALAICTGTNTQRWDRIGDQVQNKATQKCLGLVRVEGGPLHLRSVDCTGQNQTKTDGQTNEKPDE